MIKLDEILGTKKFNKLNEKLHGKSCQQNVLRERQTNREKTKVEKLKYSDNGKDRFLKIQLEHTRSIQTL